MTYYNRYDGRKRCCDESDPPGEFRRERFFRGDEEFPRERFFREREEFPRERFFRER